MGILILFMIPVVIALPVSYLIYIIIRNRLIKSGNPRPKAISWMVAIVTFLLIVFGILYWFAVNFTR